MKILAIFQYWYPYESVLQQLFGRIFDDLSKRGYNITILTSLPHFRKGRREIWDNYRGKFFERDKWKSIDVIRTYVFAPKFSSSKFSMFFRGLNYVSFFLSSLIVGFFQRKIDVIFAVSSPPLLGGIEAWLLSLIKKAPYVYNLQDVYPDIAIKTGVLKNRSLIKFFKLVETFIYQKTIKLVVLSPRMCEILSKRKRVPLNKIEIIPDFSDTEFIQPMPKENNFSKEYGLNDKFVAMFAGNMGIPQGLEYIIEAAENLKENRDILFCFVGEGEDRQRIMELASKKKLENTIFIPRQPYSRMPEVWAASDIGLVTLRKGISEDAMPSKTFGIMAAGKPVVAMIDEASDVCTMIKKAKCGICVPPESPNRFAEVIKTIYSNPDLRNEMGINGRDYVVKNFSVEAIVQKYEELFLNCIGEKVPMSG